MSKAMRCGDVVPGCAYVARGESEEEVLAAAAQHAQKDHGITSIPPDLLKKVKSAIQNEWRDPMACQDFAASTLEIEF